MTLFNSSYALQNLIINKIYYVAYIFVCHYVLMVHKAALKYMLFWGVEFVNGYFVIFIWNL